MCGPQHLQSCKHPKHHKIYVMFHGTTYAAAKQIIKHGFIPSKDGMLGAGVYVSRDINKAMKYPMNNYPRKVVLMLKVNVGKVKKIDRQNHPLQKTWHRHGYSTAWVPPNCGMVESDLEEDCVWDPRRIKVVGIVAAPCKYHLFLQYQLLLAKAKYNVKFMLSFLPLVSEAFLFLSIEVSYVQRCQESQRNTRVSGRSWRSLRQPRNLEFVVLNATRELGEKSLRKRTLHLWRDHVKGIMAHYSGNTKDFWAEERRPGYKESFLGASDVPIHGKIYVMYHGTTATAALAIMATGFKRSKDGMLGPGVYISRDINKARRYPLGDKSQQVILKLLVNVGNVIAINRQHHPLQKTWHDHGYDTAWVPPKCGMVESGLEEDCVWDPKRIKVVGIGEAPHKYHFCLQNQLLLAKAKLIMAHHSGYSPRYAGDFWKQETLPGFQEVVLRSSDLPEDGKIYVMYHGTTYSAAKDIIGSGFQQSEDGMLGPGVYVSRDKNKALRYPIRDKTDQVVLKLSVNVGKVKKIDYQGHSMQKTWSDHGYNTAWVPAYCGMVDSGLEEDCIWDPKRIKVVGIAEASPSHLEHLNMMLLIKEAFGVLFQALADLLHKFCSNG
ncbi:uncharacterized protein ACNLHF_002104 [Anomaloglossus baeobatrachus]